LVTDFCTTCRVQPLANSAMMSTLNAHCQFKDEMVTGHPPSYVKAKKLKLQTLHTHVCRWLA